MEDRQHDRLIESIDSLTSAVTELAVKVKRATNASPITQEMYQHILDKIKRDD